METGRSILDALTLMGHFAASHLSWILFLLMALMSWIAALHALFNKRDPRAALGWIAVCLMFPPVGMLLYFLFGINRVHTQGKRLGRTMPLYPQISDEENEKSIGPEHSKFSIPQSYRTMTGLADRITRLPLLSGNRVEPLQNGEEAFPAMLDTIDQATQRLYLSTYIFETNRTGRHFIEALGNAVRRGVDVRVILDGVGEYYSWPRAGVLLLREHVPTARFLPPRLWPPSVFINLRNHRKILVADGKVGYTGGMNIGDHYLAADLSDPGRIEDMHFKITGPVAAQMEQVFLADWLFCTGAPSPMPREDPPENFGEAFCRTVVDGPNEDMDKLAMILLSAAAAAKERIYITTPYFLPSRELIGLLQSAALRGVDVRILLPSKNNLPYVKWASTNMLWELLQRGVRVFYQPPPFVHSKIFLVDDFYSIIGSANIDPRSLRLNFEMVLEVFDRTLNQDLAERFARSVSKSKETTLQEVDARSLPVRIRDALCWLFTPYL